MKDILLKHARLVDPSQSLDCHLDVLVSDGKIAEIGPELAADSAQLLEADGLICAPGLVDMHVHFRDPGQTYKEDLFTGSDATAAGGVTSVACMPNTVPVCDSAEMLAQFHDKESKAKIHCYQVAAITKALSSRELTDFQALKSAGAIALSDDGKPVHNAELMRKALIGAHSAGLPVLSHCEEWSITNGGLINRGEVSEQLGIPGVDPAAEEVATAREIALAQSTGCPVHICHVSTANSVAMIRDAQRRGVPVTAETAPHYFALTEQELLQQDADYRMSPPLRTEQDRLAVCEGLHDGTLSVIATDHAPHSAEEKQDFRTAPNGVVGLETSLAAAITFLVKPGILSLSEAIACMSVNPANLLHLKAGSLKVGYPADIVLFDPEKQWIVEPEKLHSKSHNSAFKGKKLTGQVQYTLVDGQIVFSR